MSFHWIFPLTIVGLTIATDPLGDFCRIHSHRTAVVDRKLYIDGGFVNRAPLAADPVNETNTWFRVGDLDSPYLGFPNQTILAKNDTVPSVSGGILWPDTVNKIIYAYGGEHKDNNDADKRLWFYDILYDTWNISIEDSIVSITPAAWGAGTTHHNTALGYYYGGWPTKGLGSDEDTANPLSTMTIYNMVDHKFSTQSGPDQIGRAEGVMLYVPAGDAGLLVYFGGVQMINGAREPLPMSDIYVYDIANVRWYKQTTSGAELPESRRRFCAGIVWTEDRSSYNIYLFGGASVGEGLGYGDVWILSLPSFTWIKFFPTSEDNSVTVPHHSLTCDIYEKSQMIIMGGSFPNSTDCDVPSIYAQHGLDLGRAHKDGLKWAAFNASMTTYNVPLEVTKVIGGDASGNATATAPGNGWETGNLGIIFSRIYTPVSRAPTRSIPRATGLNSTTTEEDPVLGPAIAGTIGGLLVIIAVGICLFLLRRNQHHTTHPETNIELPSTIAQTRCLSTVPAPAPAPVSDPAPTPAQPPQHRPTPSYSPTTLLSSYTPNPFRPSHLSSQASPPFSPPFFPQETWTSGGGGHFYNTPLMHYPSELGDEKEQSLLTPVHELSSTRSPRGSRIERGKSGRE